MNLDKTEFEQLNPTCIELGCRKKSGYTTQKDPNYDKPLSELRKEY